MVGKQVIYPQENGYTNFGTFIQWYKLSKKKWLLISATTWSHLVAIIVYGNVKKKVGYALWLHAYKVLEEAKIIYGDRDQNSSSVGRDWLKRTARTLCGVEKHSVLSVVYTVV